MTVSSAPIGLIPQSLDGFAVDANVLQAFRESVVITGPNSSSEIITPVSTQPISMYGVPVWMLGTPGVTVSGSTQVLGTVSTFPTGTTSVFVVSSVPNILAGTSQIFGQVSSFPIGTTQVFGQVSSFPTGVTSSFTVNLTTTSVNVLGTSQVLGTVSTFPIGVMSSFATNQLTTTSINVLNLVSTFPTGQNSTFVANAPNVFAVQSSAPWVFSEAASTAGGASAITLALLATLNTTVVKATPGQIYGVFGSNIGSSNVFVRFYNLSTAALTIASTAVPLLNFGLPISTSPSTLFDLGVSFNSGITLLTQQQPYTASSSVAPTASTATITVIFK